MEGLHQSLELIHKIQLLPVIKKHLVGSHMGGCHLMGFGNKNNQQYVEFLI